jgi:fructose-1,6-bisphosphatase/inositol monophosphatase family enzyme
MRYGPAMRAGRRRLRGAGWQAEPVFSARDSGEVERLVRTIADGEIMPRFGRLAAADIVEKAPGDLVTVADRAAEEALSIALSSLVPGSVVVGEEGVGTDPRVLDALGGSAPVWVIDPIDGTHNYATDNPRFATLVALCHGGELLASWTYVPVFDVMATARAGAGAYVNGMRVRAAQAPAGLRYLDVCTPQQKWWTVADRARFNAMCHTGVSLCFFDTSGLEYIELATGRRAAMVLTWESPWDHAAGLLLHAEAGGVSMGRDGRPFTLTGGNALPVVVAPDEACAAALQATFAEGEQALDKRASAGKGGLDRHR